MTNGTDKPPEQPSPAQPQPNQILAQPATVETCRADYDAGADVRSRLGWKDAT
ncbi:hypothetical protein [Streptomyces viridochromogenes]|uniref:hypothetical protein n=1 Tax=Streptomyces viridochromogenes TaxID=1938 RepID=UPI000A8B3949|nr:hypothetical protein [Streptomyces viridochromogenes]